MATFTKNGSNNDPWAESIAQACIRNDVVK